MADDPMPPLGPPYGPAGPPPPPSFPDRPPLEWGPRPQLPVPPPPAPPSDRRAILAAVAGVVVAVLIAATVGYLSRDDGPSFTARRLTTTTTEAPATDQSTDSTATDSTDSTSSSSVAPTLEQAVADIQRFVEKQRGLRFKTGVPVTLLSGQAFDDELLKQLQQELPQVHESQDVLRALELVPDSTDLAKTEQELLTIGVVGFYDPETKRLVVQGESVSPFVRKVLAHELTHALDDQWFDLNRTQLDTADDETGVAFGTLAEGDARVVEDAYAAEVLSASERADADAEEQGLVAPHEAQILALPPVLVALLQFPYDQGTTFIDSLVAAGGQQRVDEAFGKPPVTTEQVMWPDKFLAGEPAQGLTEPAPDGGAQPVDKGVLGVLLLGELLDGGRGYDATKPDAALESWGGDRYVTWDDGARTCIKDVVVGDDAAGTAKLLQRFQDWAASPGVSAKVAPLSPDAGSAFTIVSCSPG